MPWGIPAVSDVETVRAVRDRDKMPFVSEGVRDGSSRSRSREWSRLVSAGVKHSGVWATWNHLQEMRSAHPEDLSLRGYCEILRNQIVREFVASGSEGAAIPRHSSAFLEDYSRFTLDAQEGYLISLIDGQLSIEKLLKVSPLDHFNTLFTLARLLHLGAIEFPE